jgi:hypothetical protein
MAEPQQAPTATPVYDSCNTKFCIWNMTIQRKLKKANAFPFKDCPYYDPSLPGCRGRSIVGERLRVAFNSIDFTAGDKALAKDGSGH